MDPDGAAGAVGQDDLGPPLVLGRAPVNGGGEEAVRSAQLIAFEEADVVGHGFDVA